MSGLLWGVLGLEKPVVGAGETLSAAWVLGGVCRSGRRVDVCWGEREEVRPGVTPQPHALQAQTREEMGWGAMRIRGPGLSPEALEAAAGWLCFWFCPPRCSSGAYLSPSVWPWLTPGLLPPGRESLCRSPGRTGAVGRPAAGGSVQVGRMCGNVPSPSAGCRVSRQNPPLPRLPLGGRARERARGPGRPKVGWHFPWLPWPHHPLTRLLPPRWSKAGGRECWHVYPESGACVGSFCPIPGCPRSQALPAEAPARGACPDRAYSRVGGFPLHHRSAGHGLVVGGMGTSPGLTSTPLLQVLPRSRPASSTPAPLGSGGAAVPPAG